MPHIAGRVTDRHLGDTASLVPESANQTLFASQLNGAVNTKGEAMATCPVGSLRIRSEQLHFVWWDGDSQRHLRNLRRSAWLSAPPIARQCGL